MMRKNNRMLKRIISIEEYSLKNDMCFINRLGFIINYQLRRTTAVQVTQDGSFNNGLFTH
jgi:hypothetical protein